jgi:hypothetical protein
MRGPNREKDRSIAFWNHAVQGQGPHRLGRARNDFKLAQEIAVKENWTCNWRYVEAPGVGRSAGKMLRNPACIDATFGRNGLSLQP